MISAGSVSGGVTAATIAARRKRLVRGFRGAGAVDAASAIRLADIGEHEHYVFRRMAAAGVFVQTEPGLWHLDEAALPVYMAAIRRRVLWVTVIGLVGLVIVLLVI
ncbi:MAG: hypothetical protein H6810_07490 [Phycisphaeraceae bacterium]|nr:MAG: hypothetical protein H6810_07490 [Phycisphaeraceae bacterium]